MEDEKDNADKTAKNEEEFDDDLQDAFSDDEDEVDQDDDSDDDKEGDDKEKGKKDEKKPKKSSAIIQKQKFREKLNKALDRIKELEGKKETQGQLTEEQKREKAADEFLVKKIREVMDKQESAKKEEERKAEELFQDELDEVLENSSDLTEKQIVDMCEELEISPKQAVKVIEREKKLNKGKDKPKIPNPKRGSAEVDTEDDGKPKKPQTLDSANRNIKEKIRKGLL